MTKQVIWKHQLEITSENKLELVKGAEVLSIQFQNGVLCLWEIHNDNKIKQTESRYFDVYGTGQPIVIATIANSATHKLKFLATVQQNNFVWHVFELVY